MNKPNAKLNIIKNGILTQNPALVLVLGCCPILATTTSTINAISMGACVIFVLVCSNVLISLLRKVISDKVRIPAYITIIATFVTAIDRIMAKFLPEIYEQLGLFIPLIVVNCIILGRAEAFAQSNGVFNSLLDGIGMGVGFTLALGAMGFVRELFGSGGVFGKVIPFLGDYSMTFFILPAGGFLVYGLLIAATNAIVAKANKRKELMLLKKSRAEKEIEGQLLAADVGGKE